MALIDSVHRSHGTDAYLHHTQLVKVAFCTLQYVEATASAYMFNFGKPNCALNKNYIPSNKTLKLSKHFSYSSSVINLLVQDLQQGIREHPVPISPFVKTIKLNFIIIAQ